MTSTTDTLARIEATLARRSEAIDNGAQRDASGAFRVGGTGWDATEVIGRDGLDMSTGEAALYSARQVPWHRLGTVTDEALTADDALRTARLDWTVEKKQVQVVEGLVVPGKWATVRTDTGMPLGIVGKVYTPLQNAEAFDFLTDLTEISDLRFETAGALENGAKVFVSVVKPDTLALDAEIDETLTLYVVLVNSHDGNSPFRAMVTPIRPVCKNTVRWGAENAVSSWSIRHSGDVQGKAREARRALGLLDKYEVALRSESRELLGTKMTDAEFDQFIQSFYPLDEEATDLQKRRHEERRGTLHHLFSESPTQENIRGTAWAAEQSVVEYLDWLAPLRPGKSMSEEVARGARVVTGSNDEAKTKAHKALLTLVRR